MTTAVCRIDSRAALALLPNTSVTAEESEYTLMEREVDYLVNLWPDDYGNVEQPVLDTNVGRTEPANGGHRHYSLAPDEQGKAVSAQAYLLNSGDLSDVIASDFSRIPKCDL